MIATEDKTMKKNLLNIVTDIKSKVDPARIDKLPLNTELLKVCVAGEINYGKAEELLKKGAEPLGYIENDEGWPDNLYSSVLDVLYQQEDTKEDYYSITELFLKYKMNISKPAVPYDGDWILNPMYHFIGRKNDCMLRTMRLLLDHGLNSEDAWCAWGHQTEDFVNVDGCFSDENVRFEFPDYVRMLMLIASYQHVLKDSTGLQQEIWFDYNKSRCDLLRFREWDWYDYEIDWSRSGRIPRVSCSVVTIKDKQTGEEIWTFGISLSPEDVYGNTNMP